MTGASQRSTGLGRTRPRPRFRWRWGRAGLAVAILGWLTFALGPYVWMFLTSLKPKSELYTSPVQVLPHSVTFLGYKLLFTTTPFLRYFLNSAIVSAGTVALATVAAVLAAYALSRFRIPGKTYILIGLLVTQLIPSVLMVMPLFLTLRTIGLLNTWWGLILVDTAFALPFTTYLLTGFMDAVPKQLDEAAMIDGCNEITAFRWVLAPLLVPGIAASSTYVFIYSWNEFVYALTFTSTTVSRTLPVGLRTFIGEYLIRWDLLTAGGVISVIPTILFFMLVQRNLIAGLTAGAVKG